MPTRLHSWSIPLWSSLLTLGSLVACTPALDWREVRPEGAGVQALFPCKPTQDVRRVRLAGDEVEMHLHSCKAGADVFALASLRVADPSRVTPVLEALRRSLAGNLSAQPEVKGPLKVPGMTPNPQAERVSLRGRFPDQSVGVQEAGFFAKGTTVYQAVVMGSHPDAEAVATFFENLRLMA